MFNVIDWFAQKPIKSIRGFQRINDNVEAPNYNDDAKALPNLWVWQTCGSCEFADVATNEFGDNQNQTGAKPVKMPIDTSDLELIDQRMQELDNVYQGSNGLRTMIKGTYYPKNKGTHEIIVVRKTNITAFIKHVTRNGQRGKPQLTATQLINLITTRRKNLDDTQVPWKGSKDEDVDRETGEVLFASVMPYYSIAFDYSKPVGHSRKTQLGILPSLEYDWFWFDADGQDIEYGMDMSIYLQGIVGPTNDSAVLIEEVKKYLPKVAQREQMKRSQQVGILIKPAGRR